MRPIRVQPSAQTGLRDMDPQRRFALIHKCLAQCAQVDTVARKDCQHCTFRGCQPPVHLVSVTIGQADIYQRLDHGSVFAQSQNREHSPAPRQHSGSFNLRDNAELAADLLDVGRGHTPRLQQVFAIGLTRGQQQGEGVAEAATSTSTARWTPNRRRSDPRQPSPVMSW